MPKNLITVLYVHSSDEMYGADLILLQLVEGLDKNHFRPIVVIPTDVNYRRLLSKALQEQKIEVIYLKTAILRRKYFTPWGFLVYFIRLIQSTIALIRIIHQESVDIIHSNTAAVIPGALAARLMGKRHVWHIHEIITKPRLLSKSISWLLPRLSDVIVAVSGATRDHLCMGDSKNENKVVVIYNGLDLRRFESSGGMGKQICQEWGIDTRNALIGMVGRISYWKGQDYFLQVAKQVIETHPQSRFALVGGTFHGNEKLKDELLDRVKELGLEAVTVISNFRSDIPAILNAFDVFVLPSTQPDPFPTVVLEAMAAARPVVANAHGGCIEMILDHQTGYLVPPNQPSLMASRIGYLIDHPGERRKMGLCGRERLLERFTLNTFLQKWTEIYQQLCGQTNPLEAM
jgi:glycosyltransferase involved in cell wall biosynthesis